jgi:hypothetical protein
MDVPPKIRSQAGAEDSNNGSNASPTPDSGGYGLNSLASYHEPGTPGPVLVTSPPAPSRAELWLRRFSMLVFVVFCVWIGMLLLVLPWTDAWTQNNMLMRHPSWRTFFALNFVRGATSGLGLVDVWLGVRQAVHYREK